MGPIARGIIMVVFTERSEDSIRIISARRATTAELRLYRNQMEGTS
ncbi:MAG: BrnT family toxin [Planctomycetota bacterium]